MQIVVSVLFATEVAFTQIVEVFAVEFHDSIQNGISVSVSVEEL
jgi:hypothetical protein